ncbi:hypothetical protein GGI25_002072 [Coemansia spiralis]|uniref:DASH complex subunit DAD1 n=2 Tax=Coemansia TaxID=4863 RepID=A0A9W8GB88_9FUNG|nr:hypothetical protein BX070DRAFT_219427 [Coemansia spiralis]KAJ1988861.1 hypothetical protein EDC05_005021 [Coemansia umbellata]KAJ2619964.1 hypothetical protein GGI26_005417 [Coemansia sp. RSA 1358]KAJ2678688.1 hypothetical protein GGI25_002072 [Coemansia spiralis]
MDRTELLATSHGYHSRSQYEREKERLIIEINQGMDSVNRNLVQLNQNLESAIALSTNFGRIASLWSEFGAIINPLAEEDNNSTGSQHSDCESDYNEQLAGNNADCGANEHGAAADPEDGNASDLDLLMDEDL